MDANGQTLWMLAERAHYLLAASPGGLQYDRERRCLQLASQQRDTRFGSSSAAAAAALERVPHTLDDYGNQAYWNAASSSVEATGAMAGALRILELTSPPTDIVMGHDGVLHVAVEGAVGLHDRRERWEDVAVSLGGFVPWRMTARPGSGVWVLDRDSRRLAALLGQPLPQRSLRSRTDEAPAACEPNPDPPRLVLLDDAEFAKDETPVALSASPAGTLAVLCWLPGGAAAVRFLEPTGALSAAVTFAGVQRPFSIGWAGEDRLALLVAGVADQALVYPLSEITERLEALERPATADELAVVSPIGDLYPLRDSYDRGPFAHSLDLPCRYATTTPAPAGGTKTLRRLGFPSFAQEGEAFNNPVVAPLDSHDTATVWHRLFIEAVIPAGCSVVVSLAASNDVVRHGDLLTSLWYPHRFGAGAVTGTPGDTAIGVWESHSSEIPHHPGLIDCAPEPGRAGLFSVLIQRNDRRVRALKGRYLHVRLTLRGTGRATPQIFAVRAYASRFSYVEEYLPQLYKETLTEPEANDFGPATPADFLDRFVANMEGVMTAVEDRIAAAHVVTDPRTVPAESIDWLAGWLGLDFDDALDATRRRALLSNAAHLNRWRGTLRGLGLALEIVTGGAVSGGEIVVLEDFRLRRTFATIIGADLADADDPLTTGAAVSGNAYVGDTLFLGEPHRDEFLALFAADLDLDAAEQAVLDEFFERLAHRVTVLVHNAVQPQDLGLIRRVAEREVPAHVELKVLTATPGLLVGMASLVGVDTYLVRKPAPAQSRFGTARLGYRDYVAGPAALDPRLEGIGSGLPIPAERLPVAIIAPTGPVPHGDNVVLDGNPSRAFGERHITRYNWSLNEEDT